MTLVLAWKHHDEIVVIADTLFGAKGRPVLGVGPKIFPVPIRVSQFGSDQPPTVYPDCGFAFAGHSAAGQVAHALASAGTANLSGPSEPKRPSVSDVAHYYGRCASFVVNELLKHHQTVDYLFEGLVFGYENNDSKAYSLEVKIDNAVAYAEVEEMDFNKFLLHAIGQGHEKVQEHIDASWADGRRSTVYEALLAVIANDEVPSVGGAIQAAIASERGVQLKPVLRVNASGLARGGFMGADGSLLGIVGDLFPSSIEPIVIPDNPEE